MKKLLLYATVALLTIFSVNAQIVNIPDPNFKAFLVNHHYNTNPMVGGTDIYLDSNHDGEIQYSEAAVYTSDIYNHAFFLQGLNITDLTGIEAFQGIEWLNVPDNPLTALNITGCLSLKRLTANYNNLFTTLNLVNPSLEIVDIACPTITSIDLSGCPGLKNINCSNNPLLTNFNINGCTAVEELRFYANPLLTSITMGFHYLLTLFQCTNSALTAIDVSSCHSLQYLFITGNPLTSLNMANGNPQSFVQIIATGFPDLTCIKVNNVSVSEYLWTQTGGYYQFDEWVNFSTDCTPVGPCTVTIPDVNFKAELVGNNAINTNGNNEIECTEAEAYAGPLNVDSANISDMTGIAAFTNITSLSCNDNNWGLTTLDVSGLKSLTSISCLNNIFFTSLNASGCIALTSVDVASFADLSLNFNGCTALTGLSLNNKHLISLDVSHCSALTSLVCNDNALEALNLEGCTALTTLNCSKNAITSLALNGSPLLTDLNCSFNTLTALNVIDNTNLTTINCSNNHLPYLLVSNSTALAQLDCSHNNINYLDVNNNLNLTNLNCSFNNLNTLNVSANAALSIFDCSNNNLTSQNVNSNTALISFNCSHNNIASQDVSFNSVLASFYCDYNNLATVNISNNGNLKFFSCSYNQLPALDLSNIPALIQFDCSHNQLTTLDLSGKTHLIQLGCSENQLATLDLSETHCLMLVCDSNGLESLNFANGYNVNAFSLSAVNNPALTCIQVDDAQFSTQNWTGDNFLFDPVANFSEDCSALGVVEVSADAFSVYPNPTHSSIYFPKQARIQVYNIAGQIIADKPGAASFDFSGQPSGFYLVTFRDDSGQVIQRSKIIKD